MAVAILVVSLLTAPAVVADYTPLHEGCADSMPAAEHAECHENQDSPALGALAFVGVLGALAFLARRRSA